MNTVLDEPKVERRDEIQRDFAATCCGLDTQEAAMCWFSVKWRSGVPR